MFSPESAPAWSDRVYLFTMRRESVRGYAGAPQRWRFSMTAKASNRYCLAMFSTAWAKRLTSLEVKKINGLQSYNRLPILTIQRFNYPTWQSDESPNRKDRGV